MVQYVFTPWRDRQELLTVRRQLYPQHHNDDDDGGGDNHHTAAPTATARAAARVGEQQHAVARVSMWMQRGGCPHLVESTALLRAAILSDPDAEAGAGSASGPDCGAARSSGSYAARAAYSAAFSRFVTGLLDSNQDKQRKMSMYAVAKSVGLPATFVELRHQATHEQLPSLTRLRAAAQSALDWIWEYYWRHLVDDAVEAAAPGGGGGGGVSGVCRDLVKACLAAEEEGEDDAEARRGLVRELRRYGEAEVLRAVGEVSEQARDLGTLRRALSLSREIFQAYAGSELMDEDAEVERGPKDINTVRSEISGWRGELQEAEEAKSGKTMADKPQGQEGEEEGPSWSRYDSSWVSKPIGVV